MNICIFPGTFNPIHIGHIMMAEYALRKYNFDKIIFIPAYIPPHKNINTNLAEHRFNMVKLAIEGYPKFNISDIEYKSSQKSYSLITVKKIIEQYNISGYLNFIIGTDAFSHINSWYKADELQKLVHFIVFPRKGNDIISAEGWNYEITDMKLIDVSSTEIRSQESSFVNKKVEEYIKKHGLYKI